MPGPYKSTSGNAYPDDLKLLKKIYDDLCSKQNLQAGSPVAQELGKAAMNLLEQGVFDEKEIRERLQKFIDAKPMRH